MLSEDTNQWMQGGKLSGKLRNTVVEDNAGCKMDRYVRNEMVGAEKDTVKIKPFKCIKERKNQLAGT